MNKRSELLRCFKRNIATRRLETGFSMLEAVVVVGVLLALAIGGFLSYGSITDNAKKAAVKAAASQVHTGVVASSFDGDSNTKPNLVIDEWNASTDKVKVEIVSPKDGETSTSGDFCIKATHLQDSTVTALAGTCDGSSTGGNTGDNGNPIVKASALCNVDSYTTDKFELIVAANSADQKLADLQNCMIYNEANPEYYDGGPLDTELWNAFKTMINGVSLGEQQRYTLYRDRTDIDLKPLFDVYNSASNNFWDSPTAENQAAMIAAEVTLYKTSFSTPLPDMEISGGVQAAEVVSGTNTPVTFTYNLSSKFDIAGMTESDFNSWQLYLSTVTKNNGAVNADNDLNWTGTPSFITWNERHIRMNESVPNVDGTMTITPEGSWHAGDKFEIVLRATQPGISTSYYYRAFTITVK